MGVNLIAKTEDFTDSAEWSVSNLTLTPGAAAPPSGFSSGSQATTFDDSSAAAATLTGTYYTVAGNSSVVASIFIKKDAVTARRSGITLQLAGGGGAVGGITVNTSAGTAAVPTGDGSAPTDFGVVDFDANYWRVWIRIQDAGGNTQARMFLSPASYDNFNDFVNNTQTGSAIMWGANLMVASALETYQ